MQDLVESFTLAPDDPAATKESEASDIGGTSSIEYDLIQLGCADIVTEQRDPADEIDPTAEIPEARVTPCKDERSGHRSVSKTEGVSRPKQSKYTTRVLIYGLQVLPAHRLGAFATRRVQETHNIADLFLGFLSMSVVTVLVLISLGHLEASRSVTLRGYRTHGRYEPLMSFIRLLETIRCLHLFYFDGAMGEASF
ncbi:hypothetical protein LTR84_009950 [Exophiala bonariae]|uniref:Uncharacterized protein n=1 Tax=Exophiala bonariae TaxID=1690606 RepID=A0AAV9NK39_9EURO|nr:hypothetical protein LTR84_009950 [Exophiala bonariae]